MGKTVAIMFYVSPSGDDSRSGRVAEATGTDGPFRTIQRAQRAVRELKAGGKMTAPVTVCLRRGTYLLDAPLVFTPEDSGTAQCPITWTVYRGETAVISGGVRVGGFQTDEKGRWVAAMPAGLGNGKTMRQLFVNGERRFRPQLPREGFYRLQHPVLPKNGDEPYGRPADRFEFAAGDLRADWKNLGDVEVVVYQFWVDLRLPIKSIDQAAHLAIFTRPSRRRLTDDWTDAGARYQVENVFEALDQPGQWYYDRPAGRLIYLPKAGEDPRTAEVIVPRLSQLVRFEGQAKDGRFVEHLKLQGLTFAHTEWDLPPTDAGDIQAAVDVPGAIWMTGAQHCAIEGCTLHQLGTYAIELEDGCREVDMVGNELADLGGGGIKLTGGAAGSPDWQRTRAIRITDNRIHDGGLVWHQAVGVLLRHAADCVIAHNEIHHLYYTAISAGWVWGYGPSVATGNRIEFNLIHDIGRGLLSDMGGVYTLGVSPGTVIRNNVIHDIESYGYGGWGLYTDEGSTGILLENNLVYRTKSSCFHQHYGKENVLRNNLFALSRNAQLERTRQEPHLGFTFERNIVYWTTGELLAGGGWKDDHFAMDYNLYWNTSGRPWTFGGATLEAWRKRGHDEHSLVADPLLVDPGHDNFALKENSPALGLGFTPIDTSTVGPRQR
jgi:hypothetical protein